MSRKSGLRYHVAGVRKILFPFLTLSFFILHPSSLILAQHTRLYACALASDDPAAFMGGSSLGSGLWQSDDTAKTWKQLGWKHVKCYSVDVVNNSNGKIIYQSCGNGVLRSTDAGVNWKLLTDWRVTEVMDIVIDQQEPNNIYIATSDGIWKSDDGGNTWYETDIGIPYPIFVSRIKIDPVNHLNVYAATENGLYESKDGAALWNKVKGGSGAIRDMIIGRSGAEAWVDDDGGCYFNGAKHFIRADSLGSFWCIIKRRDRYLAGGARSIFASKGDFESADLKNIHSMTIIGGTLFMASLDGGVWRKNLLDNGAIPIQTGLPDLQVWRIKTVEIE